MTIFLLSVLASVIGAAVYAVFFSKREDAIRAFLAKQQSGWTRRYYVKVFIHAIRGEARAGDTRSLEHLLLVYPVAIMLLVGVSYATEVFRIEATQDNLLEIRDAGEGEGPKPETLDDLEDQLQGQLSSLKRAHLVSKAILILAFGWYIWMLAVKGPYAVYCSRFTHELDRFLLRIQGLASKNELAYLAQLEAKVRDEATAVEYVTKMASIAKRYRVDHLVDTFMLWGPIEVQDDA